MAEEAAGGGGLRRGAGERDEEAVAERGPGAAYHMFVLMEDLLDKLKLLSYEEEVLRRHNMRPFSRCPSPAPPAGWRRCRGARKAPGRAAAASPGRRWPGSGGGPAGAGGSRRLVRSSTRGGPQPPRVQRESSGTGRPRCWRGEIPAGGLRHCGQGLGKEGWLALR